MACYTVTHGRSGRGYFQDVLAAHEDVGLLLREGSDGDFAFAFASLAPWKVSRQAGRQAWEVPARSLQHKLRQVFDSRLSGACPIVPCAPLLPSLWARLVACLTLFTALLAAAQLPAVPHQPQLHHCRTWRSSCTAAAWNLRPSSACFTSR